MNSPPHGVADAFPSAAPHPSGCLPCPEKAPASSPSAAASPPSCAATQSQHLTAVWLVDGRSGSGKTSLAARIVAETGAQTLHLEDLYPGWGGLSEGSAAAATALERGEYRRYDWIAGEFSGEAVHLDPARPLVIEGCGAITRANLAAAEGWRERHGLPGGVHSIWLELGEAERRARALARDGETFAPHWEHWAAQEREHFGVHEPWLLASHLG